MRRRAGEVHDFIVWSNGRDALTRIVDDVAGRFRLLDVVEVTWSADRFAHNLTRFYGDALSSGSEKERHGGTDPFVVAVVHDPRPRYGWRRLSRGWGRVNVTVIDARNRYRSWTGGGYRVHASETAAEAERDLVQLFGRRAAVFLAEPRQDAASVLRQHRSDLVGAHGWADIEELLLQLEVTSGQSVVTSAAGTDLTVAVDDRWWAEQVAGGRQLEDGAIEVTVGGVPARVELVPR